jgi:hypothetical protein
MHFLQIKISPASLTAVALRGSRLPDDVHDAGVLRVAKSRPHRFGQHKDQKEL